ncbi:MAG: hypothetical protein V4441_06175, partial [Pseudomonadota bacterium]
KLPQKLRLCVNLMSSSSRENNLCTGRLAKGEAIGEETLAKTKTLRRFRQRVLHFIQSKRDE